MAGIQHLSLLKVLIGSPKGEKHSSHTQEFINTLEMLYSGEKCVRPAVQLYHIGVVVMGDLANKQNIDLQEKRVMSPNGSLETSHLSCN